MATQKIRLNDGREMPPLGFGTWQLSPQQAKESVLSALHEGYRLIDTAKLYRNEEAVGQAIQESGIPREEIFVTTKLWNSDHGYENAIHALEESIDKLGLDYVDLYLIHWPGENSDIRHESWRAFCNLHSQGRARSIGVSNFTISHLKQLSDVSDNVPAVNQIEFNPYVYKEQKELVEFCGEHGIAVEAYSPLAQGDITDDSFSLIGKKHGKTPSQVMLRWAIQKVTVPIPRSSSPQHIKENLEVFDFELSAQEMAHIDDLG